MTKTVGRTYHHGDLRDALISAALAMLEEGIDPAALSLREAARRAGVSAMAPYRHFDDKAALLAAVATIGFERLAAALRTADAIMPPTEALIQQGVAYVVFACANPDLFRLMFGVAPEPRRAEPAAAGEAAYAIMADRVATLVPKALAKPWALKCWATAHGLAALAIENLLGDVGETPAVVADRVLRLGAMPE